MARASRRYATRNAVCAWPPARGLLRVEPRQRPAPPATSQPRLSGCALCVSAYYPSTRLSRVWPGGPEPCVWPGLTVSGALDADDAGVGGARVHADADAQARAVRPDRPPRHLEHILPAHRTLAPAGRALTRSTAACTAPRLDRAPPGARPARCSSGGRPCKVARGHLGMSECQPPQPSVLRLRPPGLPPAATLRVRDARPAQPRELGAANRMRVLHTCAGEVRARPAHGLRSAHAQPMV